jgi:methyl-accepting chemotaxis protein
MAGLVLALVIASNIFTNIAGNGSSDITSIKKNLERFSSNTRYSLYQIMEAQRNLQDYMEQRGKSGSVRQQLKELKSLVGNQAKEIGSLKSKVETLSSKKKNALLIFVLVDCFALLLYFLLLC